MPLSGGNRAITPETPMLAASIGTTLVAATVLVLEREGSLSRADLLSAHLGDRPWFDALPNADRPMATAAGSQAMSQACVTTPITA